MHSSRKSVICKKLKKTSVQKWLLVLHNLKMKRKKRDRKLLPLSASNNSLETQMNYVKLMLTSTKSKHTTNKIFRSWKSRKSWKTNIKVNEMIINLLTSKVRYECGNQKTSYWDKQSNFNRSEVIFLILSLLDSLDQTGFKFNS